MKKSQDGFVVLVYDADELAAGCCINSFTSDIFRTAKAATRWIEKEKAADAAEGMAGARVYDLIFVDDVEDFYN